MAMNVSMTLGVFVMIVVAAIVIDSTRSQKSEPGRKKRYNRQCCIDKTYDCLKKYRGRENTFASVCQQEAAVYCGAWDEAEGCCYGYSHCMSMYAQQSGLDVAHNGCKDRKCDNPGR
uniref:Con-ikot-ikot_Vc21.1 prepropeptide n=1 Tax=Conus victoriae TaxID=319920 RepID=W4VSM2_CONVC